LAGHSKTLIVGAGGHAQVVADILLRRHEAGEPSKPIGFVDDAPEMEGQRILGLPVLGSVADVSHLDHDAVLVAIGDNRQRATVYGDLLKCGEIMRSAIHPAAVIAPDVAIGEGVVICAGVVVNTGAVVGENVILNTGCTVDHHCLIGAHSHVAPGAHLGGNVRVGRGALVGIGASVIPGRSLGNWAVVGAGAAVTANLSAHVTSMGVPAKKTGGLNGCEE
jgi:sugar O-acyltransferase (sialic acid O-acetyltransferase NeuD family)